MTLTSGMIPPRSKKILGRSVAKKSTELARWLWRSRCKRSKVSQPANLPSWL